MRWNAIIDTSGTPPVLQDRARKPDEIEAEIQAIAAGSKQPVEQVRSVLTKEGGERSIASRLRNRKALDLLVENAKVTEAEWSEKSEESEVRSQNSE